MFQKERIKSILKFHLLANLHSHFLLVTWYSCLEWWEVSSTNPDLICFFSSSLWAFQGSRHILVKFTPMLPVLLRDCFSLITASGRVPFSSPVKLENLTDGRYGLYAWSPFLSLCHVSKTTFQCAFLGSHWNIPVWWDYYISLSWFFSPNCNSEILRGFCHHVNRFTVDFEGRIIA